MAKLPVRKKVKSTSGHGGTISKPGASKATPKKSFKKKNMKNQSLSISSTKSTKKAALPKAASGEPGKKRGHLYTCVIYLFS